MSESSSASRSEVFVTSALTVAVSPRARLSRSTRRFAYANEAYDRPCPKGYSGVDSSSQ